MTAAPLDRLTRLARALAVVTTRPPVAMASTPCQLHNPLNGRGLSTSRGARMASNRRRQSERSKGETLAIRLNLDSQLTLAQARDSFAVVLTRVSPRGFDDDNNAAALKSIRDGMAKRWGVDDGDPRITWIPTARTGKAHAVEAALWVVQTEAQSADVCRCRNEYETCEVCTRPALVGSKASLATWDGFGQPPTTLVRHEQGFDADDYNGRPRVVLTPNVIRAKGGA